ncbi:MAG TPA: dihydrolipoyl dehydrogenase [Steroidobacteraceae bacterium]|nr:dihydrolipoyl dehydrogenase [Steroidobacteraceae bacterium]
MSDNFDVIVIGGGPGGYPAAIRAAQNGLSVACIDAWKNRDGSSAFGGTCLNAGCIPSKALLESSELFHRAQHEFKVHGINVGTPSVDVAAMQKRKAGIVKGMTGGIASLFKSAGVTGLAGHGRLLADKKVEYTATDGSKRTLQAQHVILASGSVPTELKSVPQDGEYIVDSWGALDFPSVPARLGVIGAGVIGLELGSVWARLGAKVTILEAGEEFLAMADRPLAAEALKQLRKQGLDIRLGAKVSGAKVARKEVAVKFTDASGEQELGFDRVVVAIGRRPYTRDLLGEGTGVAIDARGFIVVDEHCRTGAADVYAVGDCVRGPMLAHKAKEEGVMAAELAAGRYGHTNYEVVPSVIYTAPEIAWVGQTEAQARAAGVNVKIGQFPFIASGRARAMEATAGFARIVADADSDRVLGVHIIGPMAGELIAEACLALEYQASCEDLQRTMHAHPTLSEAVHEAALAADKRAIDTLNR